MAAPTDGLTGDALLYAVNEAMIALHRRYYHRAPATAKTQLIGDEVLACVMGGVYTDVEKTMIELEQGRSVKATRSAFQRAMKDRFIGEVERLSGRHVDAFISDSHVGPDLQVELFILEPCPQPMGASDGSRSAPGPTRAAGHTLSEVGQRVREIERLERPHDRGAGDEAQIPPVCRRAGLGLEQQSQAGRVDEAQFAQTKHHRTGLEDERRLKHRHRGQVQLAAGHHDGAPRTAIDANVEVRVHRL
jgi:uncharacterized protein YbcI